MNSASIRRARAEAVIEKLRSEQPDVQEKALKMAIEQGDKDTAAEIARKIRNRLLEVSDSTVALDRLGLEAPTGTTFAAWLNFLKAFGTALAGDWAKYRQALRDLPQSEGWPLKIVWPVPPDQTDEQQEGENVVGGIGR